MLVFRWVCLMPKSLVSLAIGLLQPTIFILETSANSSSPNYWERILLPNLGVPKQNLGVPPKNPIPSMGLVYVPTFTIRNSRM